MSKFFGAASSSDSGSDDSSSGDESEEVKEEVKQTTKDRGNFYRDDSDSEDSEKREVISPQEKMRIAIRKHVKSIKRSLEAKEFTNLHNEFNELQKELSKQSDSLSQYGEPNFFLATLVEMEDTINSVKSSEEKSMSKNNKKNFGTLKNKFKKFIRDNYESKLSKYREDPQISEVADSDGPSESEGEESESSNEDSDESTEKPAAAKKPKTSQAKDDKSDDDIDWSMDSKSEKDESSSDDDDDDDDQEDEKQSERVLTLEERRKRWLKKEEVKPSKKDRAQKKKDEKAKDDQTETSEKKKVIKETIVAKDRWLEADFEKYEVADSYLKKAKKPTAENSSQFIEEESVFVKMYQQVKDDRQMINVLYHLLSGNFAAIKKNVDFYMPRDKWLQMVQYINKLLDLLETSEKLSDKHKRKVSPQKFYEALRGQLFLAFQRLQPQNVEYVKRLRDEHTLLILGERILAYYKKIKNEESVNKVSLIILSHLYYKHDSVYKKMNELIKGKPESEQNTYYVLKENESSTKINELVSQILENSYSRSDCVQAVLYQIYHHAIHNRFHHAKNQMTNIRNSDIMKKQDADTQILFNRTIVQIGLSAFRIGLVEECYNYNEAIANYGRIKELLGQIIKYNSTEKQILSEKKRFVPPHLQIDYELVDFIHMACAMLIEVPNMSKAEFTTENVVISRPFRKLIDSYDSKLFNGPPEQPRDNIVYASRALFSGDWRQAVDYLFAAKRMWKQIPEFEKVKQVLTDKIKEIGFKVLVYRSSSFYESYSIGDLGDLFELEQPQIKKLVCRLIVHEKFNATINSSKNIVEIKAEAFDEMQKLSRVLNDKLKSINDYSSKIQSYIKDSQQKSQNRMQKTSSKAKNGTDG